MFLHTDLKPGVLDWLLEPNIPDVRYLTLRDMLDRPTDDPDLIAARVQAHTVGAIATVLDVMHPDGCWIKPGAGYSPKYHGSVWALILLAQLGASSEADQRIAIACQYYLDHAFAPRGQIDANGSPASTADCLQGNMCAALLDLGCRDARLDAAFDWMARTATGEGIAPKQDRMAALRYYGGKCGPRFACGANNGLSCAWGAAKVMLAFAKLPYARRTPQIESAIEEGVDFLFSVEPTTAAYPSGYGQKPSSNWWKFGFPVFYVTDLLQIAEALVGLGYDRDPRLANTIALIRSKQDAQGRWLLEYTYGSKTWGFYGRRGGPSKWVTLRALRVLKAAQ